MKLEKTEDIKYTPTSRAILFEQQSTLSTSDNLSSNNEQAPVPPNAHNISVSPQNQSDCSDVVSLELPTRVKVSTPDPGLISIYYIQEETKTHQFESVSYSSSSCSSCSSSSSSSSSSENDDEDKHGDEEDQDDENGDKDDEDEDYGQELKKGR